MAEPSRQYVEFVRVVIANTLSGAANASPPPAESSESHGGAFVTLRSGGRLRGCMGSLETAKPLAEVLRDAAVSACRDPRFAPISIDELADLTIEVSILTPPVPMRALADLQIGVHGVLVRRGGQRGLFLPQVASEHALSAEAFLSRCCAEKAKLAPDAWRKPEVEVLLFETRVYHE